MKTEKKTWHDRTAGSSKIEGLDFSADRHWKDCEIKLTGEESVMGVASQKFTVYLNGERIFNDSLKGSKTIKKSINDKCSVSVTGEMKINSIPPAAGGVEVTCSYEESTILESKSVHWQNETGGISCIDNLFLEDEQIWEKCEIKIEGHKNKSTGCMVTLVADGDLAPGTLPGWVTLEGTESKVYTFDIGKKIPLVVAGYITNHVLVTGGGAKITLTGFYKK